MSWRFRVDDAVWAEIADAIAWYESQRLGLGEEFLVVVEAAFADIHDAPERWALWRDDRNYRRRVIHRFPYSMFYVIEPDEIIVVAVSHNKRLPGHWLT